MTPLQNSENEGTNCAGNMRPQDSTVRPLRDYLAVRPLAKSLSSTLITLAGRNTDYPNAEAQGEIVAVGPGRKGIAPAVKVGDRICFEDHRTYPEVAGLLIMREADVCAVMEA